MAIIRRVPALMSPGPSLKACVVVVSVCLSSIPPSGALAQVVSADASVNGKVRTIIESKKVKLNDTGVAIAAGKLFNPVKEEYRISRKPKGAPRTGELIDDGNKEANTDEVKTLQSLCEAIKGGILGPDALATEIRDKTKPSARPERFQEVSKKSFPLLAEINDLSNPDALEEAGASAGAERKGGLTGATVTFDGKSNPHTRVEKKAVRNPTACALAVDRDPIIVDWGKHSDPEITVSLLDVLITTATTGSKASAFALFSSDVSFVNDTGNIHTAEDQATPLYTLVMSAVSNNGDVITLEVLELETFGNEISDSLGNVGVDDVRSGLLSQLVLTGAGTIGFESSYSFTVKVPGDPSKSLLFLRDFGAVSASAEEEET
jgi:hypothetical protein